MMDTQADAADINLDARLAQIASAFRGARLGRRPLADFPGRIPEALSLSYRIQDQAIQAWPDQVRGWKVGRILGDLVQVHGTDRLIGPVFANTIQHAIAQQPVAFEAIEGGFCAVEGEFVFELTHDADPAKSDYTADEALELVGDLWTGIEIAGSPLAIINDLGPTVVVSDFGNNAGLILGQRVRHWRARLDDLTCAVAIDACEVGRGSVLAFPGGISQSLVFALNCAGRRGLPLTKGMLISTGAVSGVHDILPGQKALADFGPDGTIACHRIESPPHMDRPS